MTEPDKPADTVRCLASIMVREEYHAKDIPRVKGLLSRLCSFLFSRREAPSGRMIGGQQSVFTDAFWETVDHSTLPALLGKIGELQTAATQKLEAHIKANPRLEGYNYYHSTQLHIWIGDQSQIVVDAVVPGKISLNDPKELRDADVTAENIAALLKNYDTAETQKARWDTHREAVDTAITRATAPVDGVKSMKTIQIRKGP